MFAFSVLEQTFTIGNIGIIGIFTAKTIQTIAFVLCFQGMNMIWFLRCRKQCRGVRILIEERIQVKANELGTFLKDHEQ